MIGEALGKYRIRAKISVGGMGELYLASAAGPGGFEREVALKVIQPEIKGHEQFEQMFIEEAKIASLLSHPNLVHLYDFGRQGDVLYLCMELVRGKDLAKISKEAFARRERLGVRETLRIVAKVADGLAYAHHLVVEGRPLELVHRDVSLANVLVSFDGAVKLTDFGIARIRRNVKLTQAGVIKGKLDYMAPEQAIAGIVDGRSDVFSLGVVAWELLTGRRLFLGAADPAQLKALHAAKVKSPSAWNPDVPKEVDRVVFKALDLDPRSRFQTAHEMARAIREVAAAHGLLADDLDVALALRRLFPDDVPATGLDLGGLGVKGRDGAPHVGDGSSTPSKPRGTPRAMPEGDGGGRSTVAASVSLASAVTPVLAPTATAPFSRAPTDPATPVIVEVPTILEGARPRAEVPTIPAGARPRVGVPTIPAGERSRVEVPTIPADERARVEVPTIPAGERSRIEVPTIPEGERPGTEAPTSLRAPSRGRGRSVRTAAAGALAASAVVAWISMGPRLRPATAPAARPASTAAVDAVSARPTVTSAAAPAARPPMPSRSPDGPSAPRTARRATPPPKPGLLAVIDVHPWAQVFVDGVPRGYSPAPAISVAAGHHHVTLQNSEAGIRRRFNVYVPEAGRVILQGDLRTLSP